MQVICLEEPALFALIDKVVEHIKQNHGVKEDKWVSGEEAMHILRIKSKTTLQKLRDEGLIRFSHPERRTILYDRESLNDYLEAYAKEKF